MPKGIVRKILNVIRGFLSKDPLYFWITFFMLSVNPVVAYIGNNWRELFLVLVFYIIASYALLIITSCTWVVGRILKPITISVLFIYASMAVFCRVSFGKALDNDVISIILQTNIKEVVEFIKSFFPWWTICCCGLLLVGLLLLHYFVCYRWQLRIGRKTTDIHLMAVAYCLIVFMFCPQKILNAIEEVGVWSIPFNDISINLKTYEDKDIKLTEVRKDHPEKIVLIIGESHAKSHCSLYGYEKQTNPRLQTMADDSSLYVFTEAQSPATATIQAFKYILNTMKVGDDENRWYEHPTIITMMKSIGYKTRWYSNQDEVGLHDCTASSFAHLCDDYMFNSESKRLDGRLIEMHKNNNKREFIIYHLMGQHVDFSNRYPTDFARFHPSDYSNRIEKQRKVLAEYDNACLYNDMVVSTLMKQYSNNNAIVIYCPDHGLDLFDTSESYYGHAMNSKTTSSQCGHNIPFVVYISNKFKLRHPKVCMQLFQSKDKPICTDGLPYLILDVAGYKYSLNKSGCES